MSAQRSSVHRLVKPLADDLYSGVNSTNIRIVSKACFTPAGRQVLARRLVVWADRCTGNQNRCQQTTQEERRPGKTPLQQGAGAQIKMFLRQHYDTVLKWTIVGD